MKVLSTGIGRLDEVLRGGVREGYSLLFTGSFHDDHIILMHQFVKALLEQGKRVLLVEFRQDIDGLKRWLKNFGVDYGNFKNIAILDGYTNLYSPTPISGPGVISNPRDLPITTAIIRDELEKGKYDYLVLDDLSVLYAMSIIKEEFLRIIIRFINTLQISGIPTVASFTTSLASQSESTLLTLPFGYIIHVDTQKHRVFVEKAPHPISSVNNFRYVRTEQGIIPAWELYESVERIKEALHLDDEGILWQEDVRIQIIDESSEASLLESIIEYFGYEKARDFLYFWGVKDADEIARADKAIYKNLRESLDRLSHSTKISGGGVFQIALVEEDVVVVRGKNLFPRIPNFGKAVHWHDAGYITRIVEEWAGGKWKGEEVKCEAKGDPYCEFVIKRVE